MRALAPLILCSALLLSGCGGEEPATQAEPASKGSTPPSQSAARDSGAARDDFSESEGYGRLLAATEGIPPNPLVGNAARLERARAWVAENRADRSARERELEAQLIAVMESLLSDELRLDGFGAVMEFHALELWSKDTDGDGLLSEAEALATQDAMERTVDDALLYFGDRFDTDGDGTISDAESGAANDRFEASVAPVMSMLIDRSQIRAWDTDEDGILVESERLAGYAQLGIDPDDPGFDENDPHDKFDAFMPLADGFEEAAEFLPAGERGPASTGSGSSLAPPPERTDYDFDGDGSLSEIEQRSFSQEQSAWLADQQSESARMIAAGVQADYAVAVDRMDADGDGRIADGEWVAGFASLRAERDARIFAYFFDRDGDGKYTDADAVRFMNAYEARAPHADADMNGTVDQNDLLVFRDRVMNP